jgi:hypothetical protein
MKTSLLSLWLASLIFTMQAQTPEQSRYGKLTHIADSLYKAKKYLKSGQLYSEAFKLQGWKGSVNDRYNAACSWALAHVADSAFANLQRIASKGKYSNYDHITSDPDLTSLHADARWLPIIELVRQNKEEDEKYLNKGLVDQLAEMVKEDQKWRNYLTKYNNNELGADTVSRDYLLQQMQTTDSLNHFKLWQIFTMYGYPNYDLVGETGATNFWLLMQHQDKHPKFQEAVLEKMKIEMERGKASPTFYAYLVDRVNVNTGKLQVYGTQMMPNASGTSYEPQPVIEPEKLNARRLSVGLDSIETYIQTMNTLYHGNLKK